MASIVTLKFTHFFTHQCPKLNLLSLVNSTELISQPTLTASLAANDNVHVILRPSTTEIIATEITLPTMVEPATSQLTSTISQTMAVGQNMDISYTLIALSVAAVLISFIAIIINVTVITCCYYQRVSLRSDTCSMEPPVITVMNQAYGTSDDQKTRIYDYIDSTNDHLHPKEVCSYSMEPLVITTMNQAHGTSDD